MLPSNVPSSEELRYHRTVHIVTETFYCFMDDWLRLPTSLQGSDYIIPEIGGRRIVSEDCPM